MFDQTNYFSPIEGMSRVKAFFDICSAHSVLYTCLRLWEGIGQTPGKDDSCDNNLAMSYLCMRSALLRIVLLVRIDDAELGGYIPHLVLHLLLQHHLVRASSILLYGIKYKLCRKENVYFTRLIFDHVFHDSNPSGPVIHMLKYFRIWL